mmetsp:Transcript_6170/g.11677  ORF Transcript_6170/g.11677 Transcript_6170/m.11677 type:complete len:385 (-) Transcript_6170:171-1325(-)
MRQAFSCSNDFSLSCEEISFAAFSSVCSFCSSSLSLAFSFCSSFCLPVMRSSLSFFSSSVSSGASSRIFATVAKACSSSCLTSSSWPACTFICASLTLAWWRNSTRSSSKRLSSACRAWASCSASLASWRRAERCCFRASSSLAAASFSSRSWTLALLLACSRSWRALTRSRMPANLSLPSLYSAWKLSFSFIVCVARSTAACSSFLSLTTALLVSSTWRARSSSSLSCWRSFCRSWARRWWVWAACCASAVACFACVTSPSSTEICISSILLSLAAASASASAWLPLARAASKMACRVASLFSAVNARASIACACCWAASAATCASTLALLLSLSDLSSFSISTCSAFFSWSWTAAALRSFSFWLIANTLDFWTSLRSLRVAS